MSVGRPAEYRRRDATPSLPEDVSVAVDCRQLEECVGTEEAGDD
jgi:hypothetical protein